MCKDALLVRPEILATVGSAVNCCGVFRAHVAPHCNPAEQQVVDVAWMLNLAVQLLVQQLQRSTATPPLVDGDVLVGLAWVLRKVVALRRDRRVGRNSGMTVRD